MKISGLHCVRRSQYVGLGVNGEVGAGVCGAPRVSGVVWCCLSQPLTLQLTAITEQWVRGVLVCKVEELDSGLHP